MSLRYRVLFYGLLSTAVLWMAFLNQVAVIMRVFLLCVLAAALLYAAFLGLMHLVVVWLHFTDEQDTRD